MTPARGGTTRRGAPLPFRFLDDRAVAGNVDFLVELSQDSTECDLTFRGRHGIDKVITIRAQGDGGIQQAADSGRWESRFRFSLLCTAPIDGYAREVQLPMNSSPAVFFGALSLWMKGLRPENSLPSRRPFTAQMPWAGLPPSTTWLTTRSPPPFCT